MCASHCPTRRHAPSSVAAPETPSTGIDHPLAAHVLEIHQVPIPYRFDFSRLPLRSRTHSASLHLSESIVAENKLRHRTRCPSPQYPLTPIAIVIAQPGCPAPRSSPAPPYPTTLLQAGSKRAVESHLETLQLPCPCPAEHSLLHRTPKQSQ